MSLCLSTILPANRSLASTPAGTVIRNIARADASLDGRSRTILSSPADLRAEEILDLTLQAPNTAGRIATDGTAAVPFLLNNHGNGAERFVLTTSAIDGVQSIRGFAVDVDADGLFTAGVDTPIAVDGATPEMMPGASLALLALVSAAGIRGSDRIDVVAYSATIYGTPGTIAPAKGDAGTDAIVGATGARAALTLQASPAGAGLVDAVVTKSQSVRAPDGSDRPIRGAVVTYVLAAAFSGSGIARSALLVDPIPPGTAYRPDSLRLDGAPLTDAADGDAGSLEAGEVRVALGQVAAPAVRQLSFEVIIE